MRWIPPPSSCACRCSPGPRSNAAKPPGRFPPCGTCGAVLPAADLQQLSRFGQLQLPSFHSAQHFAAPQFLGIHPCPSQSRLLLWSPRLGDIIIALQQNADRRGACPKAGSGSLTEDWRLSRRGWGSAWDFLQWYMLAPEKLWKLTFSSAKLFPVLFEEDDVRNQQTEIFPERLTGATA